MHVAVTLEVERLDDTGADRDGLHVLRAGGRAWADEPLGLDPPVLIVDTTRVAPVPGTPGCRADVHGPQWEAAYRVTPNLLRTGRAWLVEATLAPSRPRGPLGQEHGASLARPGLAGTSPASRDLDAPGAPASPPPGFGAPGAGPAEPVAPRWPAHDGAAASSSEPGAPRWPAHDGAAASSAEPGAPRLARRRRALAPADAAAAGRTVAEATARMERALEELDALVAQLGGLESQVGELREGLEP